MWECFSAQLLCSLDGDDEDVSCDDVDDDGHGLIVMAGKTTEESDADNRDGVNTDTVSAADSDVAIAIRELKVSTHCSVCCRGALHRSPLTLALVLWH